MPICIGSLTPQPPLLCLLAKERGRNAGNA
jgi:hypothetical protein